MPNWITNKVKASQTVIAALTNSETGRIDFERIIPFPGPHDFDSFGCRAEDVADILIGTPLSDHPLISRLEQHNRDSIRLTALMQEELDTVRKMLENHAACGFLHSMSFARAKWGTKWNATECEFYSDDPGLAKFETASSCPEPVLIALSQRFPEERIEVVFASEDLGCNCGYFVLLNGKTVEHCVAPPWDSMADADKAKWSAFASMVKGRQPEEDEVGS